MAESTDLTQFTKAFHCACLNFLNTDITYTYAIHTRFLPLPCDTSIVQVQFKEFG